LRLAAILEGLTTAIGISNANSGEAKIERILQSMGSA
jgi:hypothetical protein